MRSIPASVLCTVAAFACADPASRARGADSARDCAASAIFALLNDPSTTVAMLQDIGLRSTAARNLLAARDAGAVFDDLSDVDDIDYVGPVSMELLETYGAAQCDEPSCEEPAIVGLVNDPTTDADLLASIGVYRRGADNIVARRDGEDGIAGTGDDQPFASLAEIDRVSYVGDSSIAALEDWGAQRCASAVVFSPQSYYDSHLFATEAALGEATRSLDVAMYSFSDSTMLTAIENAVDRGVSVRVLYHGASSDRHDLSGSRTAELEDLGVEVRWTNKIMHHKFVLIDGPRTSDASASDAVLVTGSANWSYSAATRYDENTLVLRGDARLNLQFQQEFDHLWDHSRAITWNEDIEAIGHDGVSDDEIASSVGSDALFTSANMRTYESSRYGATFAQDGGEWAVAEALATQIRQARRSVWIASGHFRARPVYEAVLDVADDVDVRVYLDGQEYSSSWYYDSELSEYEDCIAAGESDCDQQGILFGYGLHDAGVAVRYKYYAYRWDYRYAEQMHHKYIVIDGETVLTGSYNLSPNAEFGTLENVVILSADRYPSVVSEYVANFEVLWETRRDGTLAALLDEVAYGEDDIPLVFPSMALSWDETTTLKDAIREACPAVDSEDYREDPDAHTSCPRD